ncbi:alpha/beta fold hydrolase [Halocatena marina]|uniref:Alpha/beta fold hydrolase n=1 Tax=Halocatena marina TaxID=2934937 RepID=A0ABD5YN46_9EURY|nr:alpha/beta fold hydrolase [Halocatena marina]
MRFRTLLAGTVGGIGLTAAANKMLSDKATRLHPPLGQATESYRWRGFDVSYSEAGDPDDPDLLLLHGINAAGSSAEFAAVFDELASDHHVIAPDLPGFGLSDRPPLLYSPSLYATFIADFARDVTDEPSVVASSLSGAYTVMAAEKTQFSEFVFICPTTSTMPGNRTWLRSLLRSPLVGEALFNLISSESSLRYFEADHGLYDPSNADDEYIEYRWQLTHQPGARYAPASFISGALDPDLDLEAALSTLDEPVTLVWGRETETTPLSTGRALAANTDARLAIIDEALLLPHVEHPQQFTDIVREDEIPDANTE